MESKNLPCCNGYLALVIAAVSSVMAVAYCFISGFSLVSLGILSVLGLILSVLMPNGFFTNSPNQAKVGEFFGEYVGTTFANGLLFSIPFCNFQSVSLKVETTNTSVMKVNDAEGNPIEIAAAIVWRVTSPEKVCFNIADYQNFISVQGETALRELAGSYPYDSSGSVSLRQSFAEISKELASMLQDRIFLVGIKIEDARISHLAYSSEIAQVMLRRQQAKAISEARVYIVKNAVSMVDEVMRHLETEHDIPLTKEQKIKFVSNLLIALVSDSDAQPVISVEQ